MFNLLRWLKHDAEKKLASDMVAYIAKSLPAKLMAERRQVLSAKKITRYLEDAYALAKVQGARKKMGMFKRAVLANAFRWELIAAGYPEDFVNVATEGLIVELTPGKKGPIATDC